MKELEKQPWDILDNESSKDYSHFCCYRDLGVERTLSKVTELRDITMSWALKMSMRYKWVERAKEYDAYLDREMRKRNLAKCEQIREASLTAAMRMLQLSMGAMKNTAPDDLSIKEAREYVRNALAIAECFKDSDSKAREIIDQTDSGGDETSSVVIYLPEVEQP